MDFVSVSVHFATRGWACVIIKTDKELHEKLLQVPMFAGGGSPLETCCIYLAAVVLRPSTCSCTISRRPGIITNASRPLCFDPGCQDAWVIDQNLFSLMFGAFSIFVLNLNNSLSLLVRKVLKVARLTPLPAVIFLCNSFLLYYLNLNI